MHKFLVNAMKKKVKIKATIHSDENEYHYTGTIKELNDMGVVLTEDKNYTVLVHWKSLIDIDAVA